LARHVGTCRHMHAWFNHPVNLFDAMPGVSCVFHKSRLLTNIAGMHVQLFYLIHENVALLPMQYAGECHKFLAPRLLLYQLICTVPMVCKVISFELCITWMTKVLRDKGEHNLYSSHMMRFWKFR
jgi:hypothetical protein